MPSVVSSSRLLLFLLFLSKLLQGLHFRFLCFIYFSSFVNLGDGFWDLDCGAVLFDLDLLGAVDGGVDFLLDTNNFLCFVLI